MGISNEVPSSKQEKGGKEKAIRKLCTEGSFAMTMDI